MDANCCVFEITPAQQIQSEYYGVFYNTLYAMINDAWKAELFGKAVDATKYYNKINDFHYLYTYLQFIKIEMDYDASQDSCGKNKGAQYYYDKYNLKCISQYFECQGFNISGLYDVFDLNPLTANDGINYMCIEECANDCDTNVFTINKP
jgi:hypothetical protein